MPINFFIPLKDCIKIKIDSILNASLFSWVLNEFYYYKWNIKVFQLSYLLTTLNNYSLLLRIFCMIYILLFRIIYMNKLFTIYI